MYYTALDGRIYDDGRGFTSTFPFDKIAILVGIYFIYRGFTDKGDALRSTSRVGRADRPR